MKILELIKLEHGRILNLIRTSFICISLTAKKVREITGENKGYSLGISISLLWLQLATEVLTWEKWKI